MFETYLQAALEWTAEYQGWGRNLYTLSVILMLVFTVTETWGIIKQGGVIWRMRSVDSVSTGLFLYTFPFFLMCGVYGCYRHSISMILNCFVTSIVQIPILAGLVRFRGFSKKEQCTATIYMFLPVMEIFTDHWEIAYMCGTFGCWLAFINQFRALKREWETGAVDIVMYFAYLLSTVVWFFFAIQAHDRLLTISLGGAGLIITAIIILWCWLWAEEQYALVRWS